jgi:hypothetical protein
MALLLFVLIFVSVVVLTVSLTVRLLEPIRFHVSFGEYIVGGVAAFALLILWLAMVVQAFIYMIS